MLDWGRVIIKLLSTLSTTYVVLYVINDFCTDVQILLTVWDEDVLIICL